MELSSYERSSSAARAESEIAVAVAERGLDSWRAAKLAWLDSFSAFVAEEAMSARTPLVGVRSAG
jgi:hypothetical protein